MGSCPYCQISSVKFKCHQGRGREILKTNNKIDVKGCEGCLHRDKLRFCKYWQYFLKILSTGHWFWNWGFGKRMITWNIAIHMRSLGFLCLNTLNGMVSWVRNVVRKLYVQCSHTSLQFTQVDFLLWEKHGRKCRVVYCSYTHKRIWWKNDSLQCSCQGQFLFGLERFLDPHTRPLHSFKKETQLFWSCLSFGEECMPLNQELYSILTMLVLTTCRKCCLL